MCGVAPEDDDDCGDEIVAAPIEAIVVKSDTSTLIDCGDEIVAAPIEARQRAESASRAAKLR